MNLPKTVQLPAAEVRRLRAALAENGLISDDCLAVFIGGSVARGWQHARSDTDLYVICDKPWTGETNGVNTVALTPATVPTVGAFVDGERVELRYWLDDQVDQTFAKATWEEFQNGDSIGQRLSGTEAIFLSRLGQAIIISGEDWMAERQKQLVECAFRSMWTLRWLGEADGHVRGALGMMEAGDHTSAVLSAQMALGASVDALALSYHEFGLDRKWRARRMEAIKSATLSFDRFWELTTMQTFDPSRPQAWVEDVLDVCRQIALDVEV
ncbi:nucleotidyltransferase domain-containing protein [Actinoplanes regularis]|uniref:Nucleotidyltransferase domain-containing protein n=1 Tax=Actinoplanes regularis TaxID=52697 RepID=A0A238X5G9_9ACTN|nr:nucleotidyltransferase domain-containing protein [Actinoplanes regularis]GIE86441.1 hypothetical protein Are01nite_29210 [Actinoplanes regularis]SNR53882.1 hypothetical protein SAMN06264365_10367 [Actinoplanes regularis]